MRRTYDRGRYVDLVDRLREAIPDLSLTTDLIVGFPGETEEDFAETLSLVERCAYDGAYTFLYSPRPGTEAGERLPDDVAPEVKRERMARLYRHGRVVLHETRGDRVVITADVPRRLRGALTDRVSS